MTPISVTASNANLFASALARKVAARARGADSESARLVQRRASEHILAGFLTPLSEDAAVDWAAVGEVVDEESAPQPPVDDPNELTNVGCEWLAPALVLGEGGSIRISTSFSLYVRVLPSYAEMMERVAYQSTWQQRRKAASDAAGSASPSDAKREAQIPEVWERIEVPAFDVDVNVTDLSRKGRHELSLQAALRVRWPDLISKVADLYPTHTPLRVTQADLASEEAYTRWKSQQKRTAAVTAAEWQPRIHISVSRVPAETELRRVTVRLVNCSPEVGAQQSAFVDPNLYTVRLQVQAPLRLHAFGLFRELDQSYRYDRRLAAVGINSQATVTFAPEHTVIEIDTVPITTVPRLDPRHVPNCEPDFETLRSNPLPLLRGLASAMESYHSREWAAKVDELRAKLDSAEEKERARLVVELREAEHDRAEFLEREVSAFRRGLDLLSDPEFGDCLRAFKLMNDALGRVAKRRGYSAWRLFQLVFIVKSLPELTLRYHKTAAKYCGADQEPAVDILWFAAGGGKTEAFFGVLVWQLFLDRLCKKTFGVTAFLRFPLRLLTFQQLQRLADTLAQADLVRIADGLSGEGFSIGYFVGGTQTPNSISQTLHERFLKNGPDKSLLRLARCPYCQQRTIELDYDEANRLVRHKCSGSDCPNPAKALPLFIVDDDVYRFLPSVIVSTVDKLANVGQNRRFANLFGRIDRRCAKHGAAFHTSNWMCEASKAAANGGKPEKCGEYNVRYGPFESLEPALQIADELHLLRQELGAFDGHYETTVLEVQRSLGAQPWKILAATATIERFSHHARQLYLMEARRFPGPGPTATGSFYYEESKERLGRIFIGMLGVGRAHTPSVARTKSLFLQELADIRRHIDDPTALCRAYGLPALTPLELRDLVFLYELVLTYVLTLKGGDQVSEAIDNRVRQELTDTGAGGAELIVKMLNSGIEMPEMIETIEQIGQARPDGDPSERIRAIVTTNIISHGVDIDRFGIIVFAGFPRQVAEYIQASARVGRTWPGISVFVPTPQAERDRSVFDRFGKFHEYLDRLVEPSAINRWPEPILRRTVPGVVCAYLMAVAAHQIGQEISTVQQVQGLLGHPKAGSLDADSVVAWCLNAIRAEQAPSPSYATAAETVIRNTYDKVLRRSTMHDPTQRSLLSIELGAMKSLRDVDDPAQIAIESFEEATIFKAFV